ncbi:MAG: 4,5-DOPA dioxygenase extradiol [Bacteroidota bacterium]
MDRKRFLQTTIMGSGAILSLSSLSWLLDGKETDSTMPVLFIGHGSPMNALESNIYTQNWKKIAGEIEKPKAIICISAHWLTKGSFITAVDNPLTIHDFGGFPDELFAAQYPAPGLPGLAKETQSLFPENLLHLDMEWGLDHGTWSILKQMYPLADVPVLQLSIDYDRPASYHFELAQYLQMLRKKGVLIIGSGNMVHNLGMVAWDKLSQENYGYDWAIEANELFKKNILDRSFNAFFDYKKLGQSIQLSVPTPDHFYPLMYTLGLIGEKEEITLFNDYTMGGSLSMTSVKAG